MYVCMLWFWKWNVCVSSRWLAFNANLLQIRVPWVWTLSWRIVLTSFIDVGRATLIVSNTNWLEFRSKEPAEGRLMPLARSAFPLAPEWIYPVGCCRFLLWYQSFQLPPCTEDKQFPSNLPAFWHCPVTQSCGLNNYQAISLAQVRLPLWDCFDCWGTQSPGLIEYWDLIFSSPGLMMQL